MVLTVQKTIVIPLLQFIDKVFDVTVGQGPADSSGAVCEKTAEIPQLHSSSSCWTRSFTRPLCATTDARWFSVQKTAKVPQLHCSCQVADVPVVQVVLVPQVLSAVMDVL